MLPAPARHKMSCCIRAKAVYEYWPHTTSHVEIVLLQRGLSFEGGPVVFGMTHSSFHPEIVPLVSAQGPKPVLTHL